MWTADTECNDGIDHRTTGMSMGRDILILVKKNAGHITQGPASRSHLLIANMLLKPLLARKIPGNLLQL